MHARSKEQSPGGDTTECSTTYSSKCKHRLLFQSLFWAGKADSEPRWIRTSRSAAASANRSVQFPNEERPDGSRLQAPPCAAPRGKSIVKPCAKPAPKHCQESAESSCRLPINVDGGHPWTWGDTRFLQTPASPVTHFMLLR